MNSTKIWMIVFVFVLWCLVPICVGKEVCERKLNNCTGMMQPVLNEVRYMFPVTQLEIEGMCKVWSHIMDCVRKYVIDCSSEEQRTKFNEAVSNSIDSVHAICSSERYRRDYLEYATCFRKVSMDSCGNHFKKMVDSAYNPHSLELQICCAYRQYEKCVSEPIQRLCGPQALHILDDSMSSLRGRCETITQSLKPADKMCPAEGNPLQEAQEYRGPRPALRHAEHSHEPLGTTGGRPSQPAPPHTTPSWSPRTVIYPLPATRHSSRLARHNSAQTVATPSAAHLLASLLMLVLGLF